MQDKRSRRIVLVPFCVLCQAFEARGIVKGQWSSTIVPIVELLMKNDINIIQLPCPESSYCGFMEGLDRKPAGLKTYDVREYREHCLNIVDSTVEMVKAIRQQELCVVAVLGIEMSPSCAVSYVYTNEGMKKRMGVFYELLYSRLLEEEIRIPFVGVNRRYIRKSVEMLTHILDNNS